MIGIFYGTRPEFIKLLPVIEGLDKRNVKYELVQVAQHTDLIKDCLYDERISIHTADYATNRLNHIFGQCGAVDMTKYKYVLVQGDTTTAAAVALSAYNQGCKVMHVEAGMRTYDKKNPFPEEVNRRLISSLATIHYCPTERESRFLYDEGYLRDDIIITGNTVIDNLMNEFDEEVEQTENVIITLHRRENHKWMEWWYNTLEDLAFKYPQYNFIFPMHPSPEVQKHRDLLNRVKVCDPIPHDEFTKLLAGSKCVITDSGGIQEEASYFKKMCFVCRTGTERPCEGSVTIPNPDDLIPTFDWLHEEEVKHPTPFGNGDAGEKIAEDIRRRVR